MNKLIQILDWQGYSVVHVKDEEKALSYETLERYDFVCVIQSTTCMAGEEDLKAREWRFNQGVRLFPARLGYKRGNRGMSHVNISEEAELEEPDITNYQLARYLFGFFMDSYTLHQAIEKMQSVIDFYTKYDNNRTILKQNGYKVSNEMLCIQNVCKYYLKWDGDNLLLIPKSYLKGIKDIAEHGQLDELYDYEEGKPYLLH